MSLTACGNAALAPAAGGGDEAKQRLSALEEDTSGVESLLDTWKKSLAARDTQQLSDLFTPSAQVYLQDGEPRSVAQYLAGLSQQISTWSQLESEIHLHGVKLARPYGWAKLEQQITYQKAGRSFKRQELVTMTFQRIHGHWLIDHLQISGPEHSAD